MKGELLMKKNLLFLSVLVFMACLFVTGCKKDKVDLTGTWNLVQVYDALTKEDLEVTKQSIELKDGKNGTWKDETENQNLKVKLEDGKITITYVRSNQEEDETFNYEVKDNKLTINLTSKGEVFVFSK